VAHFARNGGSLYSGLVAQYGPDYSDSKGISFFAD